MQDSESDADQAPWYMRRGSVLQSPSELDPMEDTVICPNCNTVNWQVQEQPSVRWTCTRCKYEWEPPATD